MSCGRQTSHVNAFDAATRFCSPHPLVIIAEFAAFFETKTIMIITAKQKPRGDVIIPPRKFRCV